MLDISNIGTVLFGCEIPYFFVLLYTPDTLIYIITLNQEDVLVLVVYFIHTHGIVGCKIKDLVV
jgi:hypothetical protein